NSCINGIREDEIDAPRPSGCHGRLHVHASHASHTSHTSHASAHASHTTHATHTAHTAHVVMVMRATGFLLLRNGGHEGFRRQQQASDAGTILQSGPGGFYRVQDA